MMNITNTPAHHSLRGMPPFPEQGRTATSATHAGYDPRPYLPPNRPNNLPILQALLEFLIDSQNHLQCTLTLSQSTECKIGIDRL